MVIPLSSPLQVGIYKSKTLIKRHENKEKTSEVLPLIFKEILENYNIKTIYFAKGPGSFMSIKIAYIFLKTLGIAKGINLKATDGFTFNENNPIKAMGKFYFVKEKGAIKTQKIEELQYKDFSLPEKLKDEIFSKDIAPLYVLPPV